MKLSDYKGDRALDILADIIEPAAAILADNEVRAVFESGRPKLQAVKAMIKSHKKEVTEILAAFDGEDPETYKPGLFTLPIRLIEILNDPDLLAFFEQQGQITTSAFSGSATVNTQAEKE